MSSAQSAQTSGGLVGADMASINNYTGQMEYMSGLLGLLSAFLSCQSSGEKALNIFIEGAKDFAESTENSLDERLGDGYGEKKIEEINDLSKDDGLLGNLVKWAEFTLNNRPGSMLQDLIKGKKKQ